VAVSLGVLLFSSVLESGRETACTVPRVFVSSHRVPRTGARYKNKDTDNAGKHHIILSQYQYQ
jgi:hypothetical protein